MLTPIAVLTGAGIDRLPCLPMVNPRKRLSDQRNGRPDGQKPTHGLETGAIRLNPQAQPGDCRDQSNQMGANPTQEQFFVGGTARRARPG
jgi:hypothetical protein